jgi:hypothetical protein
MGMLPPDAALSTPKAVAERSKIVPPAAPVVDPTMQGRTVTPAGARSGNEDFARGLGPAGGPGSSAQTAGASGPRRAPLPPLVTPNSYVDPLLVQRLLAKARSGYGGTFVTGPRGVLGGG